MVLPIFAAIAAGPRSWGKISDQRFPVRPRSRSVTTALRIVPLFRRRQDQLWMAPLVPFVKAPRSRCPAIASDCGRPCATSRGSCRRNSASGKPIRPAAAWNDRFRGASRKRRDMVGCSSGPAVWRRAVHGARQFVLWRETAALARHSLAKAVTKTCFLQPSTFQA